MRARFSTDLAFGYSRYLFVQDGFGATKGNVVVLTQQMQLGSLGDTLFRKWQEGQEGTELGNEAGRIGSVVDIANFKVQLKVRFSKPLQRRLA